MYLKSYTQKRVLGSHIPYAIEAYPEGNQKHLSGESALYARIITEGLFGIRPIAFDTFTCMPSMPSQWQEMKLKRIALFGIIVDIEIRRSDQLYELIIKRENTICFSEVGHQFTVKLGEK